MKLCKHKAKSYHDANTCAECKPYYAVHTSYDKDGDPYYDPSGASSGYEGLIGFVLFIIVAITVKVLT